MPFQPGNKEGAKRGPGKISNKVKESIVGFLERNVDKIQESFDNLDDKDKLKFIAEVMPYAAPKLSSIQGESEITVSGEVKIIKFEP